MSGEFTSSAGYGCVKRGNKKKIEEQKPVFPGGRWQVAGELLLFLLNRKGHAIDRHRARVHL